MSMLNFAIFSVQAGSGSLQDFEVNSKKIKEFKALTAILAFLHQGLGRALSDIHPVSLGEEQQKKLIFDLAPPLQHIKIKDLGSKDHQDYPKSSHKRLMTIAIFLFDNLTNTHLAFGNAAFARHLVKMR